MTTIESTVETRESAARRPPAARARILVLADVACTSESLAAGIARHADGGAAEILVVAPAHPSFLAAWAADDRAARADADRRLSGCVRSLARRGQPTFATIGAPDPVEAVAHILQRFRADEVVVLTRQDERSGLFHRSLADRIRRRYLLPVTHVVVEDHVRPQPSRRGGVR